MPEDQTLGSVLLVDDDEPFRLSLARALRRREMTVHCAATIAEAVSLAATHPLAYAVVDLRLGGENGLDLVRILREMMPDVRVVLLTGYGNIASAVTAIKAGAVDYLAKPVDIDGLMAVFLGQEGLLSPLDAEPMTPERVRWEHIQRVYVECGQNVSETARRLRMHRRTLQRILSKRAPV
ncbi:MAG TPA: response regulator [Magnetospirillum sp.]|jgi:two-component system response regulator RegA|nr:response regulator [Magnetospirillum sp.]